MTTLPPGPRFAPLQTIRFVRSSAETFRQGLRRYGDPFTLPTVFGTMVVTAHPEGIKEIFTADADGTAAFGAEPLQPLVGASSLLLLTGTRHKRERKLLMPPFHGERMRTYGKIIRDATLAHTERWSKGARIMAQDFTQDVAFDIILRAIFGVEERARIERFRALNEAATKANAIYLFMPALRRSFMPGWRSLVDTTARFRAVLQDEIDRQRASTTPGVDILSLLLSARDDDGKPMTDGELKDELITLIAAGHETTALTLAWALFWIHHSPSVMARLERELAPLGLSPDPEALAKLPYLGAVCDETLRLRPVAAMAPRLLTRPMSLRGHELPPGVAVIASIKVAHENPDVYPAPHEFRPERFLERKFSPFEYLPFGGGHRRCIGAAFAGYEMRVILGTLLSRHRLSLVSNEIPRVVRRTITEGPEGGVPMIYEGLRSAASVSPLSASS